MIFKIYFFLGSAYIINKTPARIAFLSELILSLMIYNYYSASVVSTRLDKPIDKINDSLVELAKADLTLAAEPSLFFNFVLNVSFIIGLDYLIFGSIK